MRCFPENGRTVFRAAIKACEPALLVTFSPS
jgi:hypothetical protein